MDFKRIGLLKTSVDVHTLGISVVKEILEECGIEVVLCDDKVAKAISTIKNENSFSYFKKWVFENSLDAIAFSYRLDSRDGVFFFTNLYNKIKESKLFRKDGGKINFIAFAGLPEACVEVTRKFGSRVVTFQGDETPKETILKFGIDISKAPLDLIREHEYDKVLLDYGNHVIEQGYYKFVGPEDRDSGKNFGTKKELVRDRIKNGREKGLAPLMRAHVGPYSPNRLEAIKDFKEWIKALAKSRLLDVLSMGTSQLTQSMFGEDWGDLPNGGGVPINSEEEFYDLYQIGRPLLFRTYAGTQKITELARIYEKNINIAWHALSLWWFSELDGRGPYTVLENLRAHCDVIKYIAKTGKPYEPNVSHHFNFRGSDDVTYVMSAVIAARLAKTYGVKDFIIQVMLNTPKYTWGVMDLAKARAILELVRELEDDNFTIYLQTRAGLDYLSHDIEEAKRQLSSVTALMDDIEPNNPNSPDIIHVVSYSEGAYLATPPIIDDSIRITRYSLSYYRELRQKGEIKDMTSDSDIKERQLYLIKSVRSILDVVENNIPNTYSPEGLYDIFRLGFLPVPQLRYCRDKYPLAINWHTKVRNGRVDLVENGRVMSLERRLDILKSNIINEKIFK